MRESGFSRYTRQGDGWKIEERERPGALLGITPGAGSAHPDHPDRVVEWLLESTTDVSGNFIDYTYQMDNGNALLRTIRYAIYEARFRYEDRPDTRLDGRAGFSRRRAKRCAGVSYCSIPALRSASSEAGASPIRSRREAPYR